MSSALILSMLLSGATAMAKEWRCNIGVFTEEGGAVVFHPAKPFKQQSFKLEGSSPASFALATKEGIFVKDDRHLWRRYARGPKGMNTTYFHFEETGLDPKITRFIGPFNSDYYVITEGVGAFYSTHSSIAKIEGADGPTFQATANYAWDSKSLYWLGKRCGAAGAALETFDGYGYAKHTDAVFFQGKPIPGADAASFAPIKVKSGFFKPEEDFSLYAKDKESVYYLGEKFPRADLATFKVTDRGSARDKNGYYEGPLSVGGPAWWQFWK